MTSPYKIYPPPSPEIRNILTSPPKKIPKFQLPSPLILAKGAHYGHAEFVTTLGFEPKTTKFVGERPVWLKWLNVCLQVVVGLNHVAVT